MFRSFFKFSSILLIFYTRYGTNFPSDAYLRRRMKNNIAYYLEDPSRLDEVTVNDVNQWLEERPYSQPLRLLADLKANQVTSNVASVGVYGAYFAEDYEAPVSLSKSKTKGSKKILEKIAPLTSRGSKVDEIASSAVAAEVNGGGDNQLDKETIIGGSVIAATTIAHNLADDFSEDAVEDDLLEVNPNVELVNEITHSSADELMEEEVENEVLENFSEDVIDVNKNAKIDGSAQVEGLEEVSTFDGNVDYKIYASNVTEGSDEIEVDNAVNEADSFSDIDSSVNKNSNDNTEESTIETKGKIDVGAPEVFHEIAIEEDDLSEALEEVEEEHETDHGIDQSEIEVEGELDQSDSFGVLIKLGDKRIKSSKKAKKKTKKKSKKKTDSKKKKKKKSDKKDKKKESTKKTDKSKKDTKKKSKKKNDLAKKQNGKSGKKTKKSSIKKVKGEIKTSKPVKIKKTKNKKVSKLKSSADVTYVLVKDESAANFKLTDYAGISNYTNWLLEQKSINGNTSDKKLESRIEKAVSKKKSSSSKKKKSKKKKTKVPQAAVESVKKSDMIISEPLANILAAQGHKKKAKKMYTQLGLIFPEKSGYFASQIEKLKKK